MKIIAYMLIFLFSIILLGLGLLGFNYFTSEHPKKEEPNITTILIKIKETNEKEFKVEVENLDELNQVIKSVNSENKKILKIEKSNNYKKVITIGS